MSSSTEPILGAFGAFPLGEYKGADEHDGERAMRPFGLRFAVPPTPSKRAPPVDFSAWSYDEQRQIALVHEHGTTVEAAKHSTGPTQTPTNTDDGTRFERDEDVTED
jgi:putative ATP-grasp target RiPP